MSNVDVKLKSGAVREFHGHRSGGSYSNSVRYEGAFAIVTDVWGSEHAFPAADIEEVAVKPWRTW